MEISGVRTDLAVELHELHAQKGEADGIEKEESTVDDIAVTTVKIDASAATRIGKRAGRYVTLDTGRLWSRDSAALKRTAKALSSQIDGFLPQGEDAVLCVGLGNEHITADALGPMTVESLIVTHHMRRLEPELYRSLGFGDLAAIAAGVLGQTGIESASIVGAVASLMPIRCVVVVDALASRRLSRLATTVQITDTGISPGSGVSNARSELTEETLGVPVISIGVPTVVDAATLAADIVGEARECEIDPQTLSSRISPGNRDFVVAPKDADVIIRCCARLISTALNLSVHRSVAVDDIPDLLA